MNKNYLNQFLIASLSILFIWSAIKPYSLFTWVLEVFPIIIGAFILSLSYKKFKLTQIAYVLLWVHALILIFGGHYTYARNPLFDWIKVTFNLSRNYYDRLGHLAQGFVPAIITREILIRLSPLKKGKWLFFVVVCICLAISASYELFEWLMAVLTGEAATDFLGTQGDVWDTQWDMFMALCGATLALLLVSKLHDKHLEKLGNVKSFMKKN